MAARQIREQLIDAFRDLYEVPPGAQAVLRHGALSAGQVTASVDEVIRRGSLLRGGQLIGTGYFRTKAADNVLGGMTAFWEPGVAGAQVRVDTETGSVQILHYVSILDVGRAINPKLCEGQDIGAAVMGMGAALCERLEFEGGQLLNASLVDYRLPTFAELPERFETVLIENGDGPGPHGARGIGEGSILPVAAALGNAIAAATGARVYNLPMTPEVIWRAMREAAAAEGSNTSVVPEVK
jgi:CO/xanthine dehydrogenase Mo-binding subunit